MFQSARIKLTFWYLLIIMAITLSFSAVVYRILSNEFERFDRVQRSRIIHLVDDGRLKAVIIPDPTIINEVKERLLTALAIIDVSILIISGGLSYFLAGKTLQPIKTMVDEQNRFISDASHELRTPLTALKSSMEVFLRDDKSTMEDAQSLVKSGIEDVENLSALSDSLLQLAQYQKVNGNLNLEPTSLLEITNIAVNKVAPLAAKKNIVINNIETDYTVNGNKYSLTDLFVILLDNAIKYSSSNQKINLSTEKLDGNVKVLVADEGVGIDEKDLPHIFDRFYRANESRSKSDQTGYGLGLSIAKRIVNIHKGNISVISEKGKGSTFIVKLPISHSAGIQKERIS